MRFEDFPIEVQRNLGLTALEQVGRGYVRDYYEQIASDWIWLYELGVQDGKKSKKEDSE